MPVNEAYLDAPRALRRVHYRGGAYTDHLAGVSFIDSVPQSGMSAAVLARLVGIGIPLDDLGPWEDTPPAIVVAPDLAALPVEPAPDDAPAVSPAHVARPAPSASPPHHHRPRR